ncbi:hypothetical protein MCEKH37_00324 [Methylophilaceae bacterium]|jgi:hypothetical protein
MDLNLYTKESPRQIIFEDYKINLPISGGWGYDIESACIIDKNDPTVDNLISFDGVSVEYVFVEKRIYEEMIIFRHEANKFWGIRWDLEEQRLIKVDNRSFDILTFDVVGFSEQIWNELTTRFEAIKANDQWNLMEDLDAYRDSNAFKFKRKFYFDVSSFI